VKASSSRRYHADRASRRAGGEDAVHSRPQASSPEPGYPTDQPVVEPAASSAQPPVVEADESATLTPPSRAPASTDPADPERSWPSGG
jgi:hypothetical protein